MTFGGKQTIQTGHKTRRKFLLDSAALSTDILWWKEAKMLRNARKWWILAFLGARGGRPATVPEIAWGTRLPYHRRGLYRLLRIYAHWGLVISNRGADGRILYRISERGRARLVWLRAHSEHDGH